jgi:hypothetical protein
LKKCGHLAGKFRRAFRKFERTLGHFIPKQRILAPWSDHRHLHERLKRIRESKHIETKHSDPLFPAKWAWLFLIQEIIELVELTLEHFFVIFLLFFDAVGPLFHEFFAFVLQVLTLFEHQLGDLLGLILKHIDRIHGIFKMAFEESGHLFKHIFWHGCISLWIVMVALTNIICL